MKMVKSMEHVENITFYKFKIERPNNRKIYENV